MANFYKQKKRARRAKPENRSESVSLHLALIQRDLIAHLSSIDDRFASLDLIPGHFLITIMNNAYYIYHTSDTLESLEMGTAQITPISSVIQYGVVPASLIKFSYILAIYVDSFLLDMQFRNEVLAPLFAFYVALIDASLGQDDTTSYESMDPKLKSLLGYRPSILPGGASTPFVYRLLAANSRPQFALPSKVGIHLIPNVIRERRRKLICIQH